MLPIPILRQSNPLESPIASHCHHYSSPHALYKKTFAESPVSFLSFITVNQHNSVHLSSYFWCSIPTASIPLSWPPYTAIIKTGMLYPIDNLLFLLHIESVSLPTFPGLQQRTLFPCCRLLSFNHCWLPQASSTAGIPHLPAEHALPPARQVMTLFFIINCSNSCCRSK